MKKRVLSQNQAFQAFNVPDMSFMAFIYMIQDTEVKGKRRSMVKGAKKEF